MTPAVRKIVLRGRRDSTAPTITSGNTDSVAENATLSHALTANEAVAWSLVGGADQARFEISGSTLRWASNGTKNFEIPNDADTNNTYVVTVRATDAANNTTDQTITVTVTDVADDPLDPYTAGLTFAGSMGRRLVSAHGAGSFYTDVGGTVSVFIDQSGAARDLTAGVGVRPAVSTVGGLACADFTPSVHGLNAGTGHTALSNYIANNAGYIVMLLQLDALSTTTSVLCHDLAQEVTSISVITASSRAQAYNFDGSTDTTSGAATAVTTGANVLISWRHEGGNLYCRVNAGTETTVASGNTSNVTGTLQIGKTTPSFGFDGKLLEFYTWGTTIPSSGDRDLIEAQAKAYASIP